MSRLDLKFWEDGTRRRHLFFFFFNVFQFLHINNQGSYLAEPKPMDIYNKTGNSISPQSTKIQAAGVNWLQPQGQLVLSV